METNKQDWQEQAQALIKNFRTKAKDTNRFVDLEDMAVHVGEEIKNLILQGAVSDKGDGRDLPLPKEMPKMKSKGSKKKD